MKIPIESFISQLAEVFEKDEIDIAPIDKFREYDEWDSITLLSLVVMLDDNYGITIPREEFEMLETVNDLFERVKSSR